MPTAAIRAVVCVCVCRTVCGGYPSLEPGRCALWIVPRTPLAYGEQRAQRCWPKRRNLHRRGAVSTATVSRCEKRGERRLQQCIGLGVAAMRAHTMRANREERVNNQLEHINRNSIDACGLRRSHGV